MDTTTDTDDSIARPEEPSTEYHGSRNGPPGETNVLVKRPDGTQEALDPRLDEIKHSPTGLEWGYRGSGPAQLAFAILADVYDADVARQQYQRLKNRWVAGIDSEEWVISAESIHLIISDQVEEE